MIIRSEEIYKKANSIVKSCGTRDTLKIARELGIHLHFLDNLNDLLGMYTYRHKERHILLNSNMEYLIMQMVCGHEIGHDTFHRDLAKGNEPLPEFVLFDMRTKHEYEANAFASHLIIINRLIKRGESEDCWAAQHIDICLKAFESYISKEKIDTEFRNVDEIAAEIIEKSNII